MRLLPQALRSVFTQRLSGRARNERPAHARDERGVAYPSPLVMLSIIAIAMAAVAFVATRGGEPTEREITPAARSEPTQTAAPTTPTAEPTKPPPPIKKGRIYVEVFNNTGIQGLAGRAAERAIGAGWQVVGSDNWVGTVPASTVYFPKRLKPAAHALALDLGIKRVQPAVGSMQLDRLTVVLTAELG